MQIGPVLFTKEVMLCVLIVFISIFVNADQGSRLHIVYSKKEK